MNKHSVFVAGKHFVLLSDDKEKYVQELAKEVGDAINDISIKNPTLDRRAAAILCALDYADDKYKEIERSKSLSDKAKPLIAQADRQSKKLREMQQQLEAQQQTIDRLTNAKKNLEEALAKAMQAAPKEPEQSSETKDGEDSDSGESSTAAGKKEPRHKKKHQHNHPKGYKPTRQISLFDNEKN